MSEQLKQPELAIEATLTSEPIEVPNIMAWRWRVEHIMREAGIASYPDYSTLAEAHAYFFEWWGYASTRKWAVSFSPTEEATSDFPIDFPGHESDESAQAKFPLLSDLLGDNYPAFITEPSDHHVAGEKLKGFIIRDPSSLVETLAKYTSFIKFGRRDGINFEGLQNGLTIALAKTQDGSIYSIRGNHDNLVEPGNVGVQSFNTFLEQAGMCKTDEERERVAAIYLKEIRNASIKDIVGRAVLHRQYSDILEAIGEGFQAFAEEQDSET